MITERRKTATGLVGEGRLDVVERDGPYIAVLCEGADVWSFKSAYDALPVVVAYDNAKYLKVSFRSDKQLAYYKVA